MVGEDASVPEVLGPDKTQTFTGTLSGPESSAEYVVVMGSPGYVSARIYDVEPGDCKVSKDTRVDLFDASGEQLGSEDDIPGLEPCLKLDPRVHRFARVGSGTYRIRLSALAAVPTYHLTLETTAAACGDGIIFGASESCDDGNHVDGDLCDHDCRVEGDRELEDNDSPYLSDHIHLPSISAALLQGDTDVFDFSVPTFASGVVLFASVGNPGSCSIDDNIELAVVDDIGDTTQLIDDSSGPEGRCGRIEALRADLPSSRTNEFYVRARTTRGTVVPTYTVWRYYTYPSTIGELEANDQPPNAFILGTLTPSKPVNVYGRIRPAGDLDLYEVHVDVDTGILSARTYGDQNNPDTFCRSEADTVLSLFTRTGELIARNDDIDGHDYCSRIEQEVERGLYYLRVEASSRYAELDAYFLNIELR